MKKHTIGIIGGGNMGEALIKGLYKSDSIFVCETNSERAKYLKEEYNASVTDISNVIRNVQIIILAVKPQDMQAAFSWIRADDLREDKLFISIAAGLTTEYFENCIKNIIMQPNPRVVRAMPNLPAIINEGITGICKGQYAKDGDLDTAKEILSVIGDTVVVEESMMDALTAVSGSGPAYVFLFIETWISAAINLGFSQDVAERLVMKTIIGSADLIKEKNFSIHDLLYFRAKDLREKVTSRGGTTEAAMKIFFENDALPVLMKKALFEAEKKAKELAK